jgi:hypothetical protein
MTKIAGSGSASGSISQRHAGSTPECHGSGTLIVLFSSTGVLSIQLAESCSFPCSIFHVPCFMMFQVLCAFVQYYMFQSPYSLCVCVVVPFSTGRVYFNVPHAVFNVPCFIFDVPWSFSMFRVPNKMSHMINKRMYIVYLFLCLGLASVM